MLVGACVEASGTTSSSCTAGVNCAGELACLDLNPDNVCSFTRCASVVVDVGFFAPDPIDGHERQVDELFCVPSCGRTADCTKGTTCAFGGCMPDCEPGACPSGTACFFGACIPECEPAAAVDCLPSACVPRTITCGQR